MDPDMACSHPCAQLVLSLYVHGTYSATELHFQAVQAFMAFMLFIAGASSASAFFMASMPSATNALKTSNKNAQSPWSDEPRVVLSTPSALMRHEAIGSATQHMQATGPGRL